MKVALDYFRQKTALCRQLAAAIRDQTDPVVLSLLAMADEFNANADALEARIVRDAAHPSCDEDAAQIH